MLGITARRIHDGQHPNHGRGRLLRRDQVDTLLPAPGGIVDRLVDQGLDILGHFFGRTHRLPIPAELILGDRPGAGRSLAAHMIGNDDRPSAFAPDLDFNLIAIHQIAVQQGQSNSAPAVGFTLPRGQPDPFALPVRNHGPAGHIPHMLIAAKHIGFSPRNSLIDQRNGPYHAGQVGNQRIVSVDDAFEGFVLSGQRRTADERPF